MEKQLLAVWVCLSGRLLPGLQKTLILSAGGKKKERRKKERKEKGTKKMAATIYSSSAGPGHFLHCSGHWAFLEMGL